MNPFEIAREVDRLIAEAKQMNIQVGQKRDEDVLIVSCNNKIKEYIPASLTDLESFLAGVKFSERCEKEL